MLAPEELLNNSYNNNISPEAALKQLFNLDLVFKEKGTALINVRYKANRGSGYASHDDDLYGTVPGAELVRECKLNKHQYTVSWSPCSPCSPCLLSVFIQDYVDEYWHEGPSPLNLT